MRTPQWYIDIIKKWQAGIAHVFLLHGNVGDTIGGVNLEDLLVRSPLCAKRKIVICYDRSRGITFPLESHREKFYEALGTDAPREEEEMLPTDPVGALRLMEQVLTLTESENDTSPKTSVIINFAETIVPNADMSTMSSEDRTVLVTIQRWAREQLFVQIGSPIFLITENLTDINNALRNASSRIEAIKVPLPDYEERKAFIEAQCESRGVEVEDIDRIAAMTAALKQVHIEDIVLRALLEDKPVTAELVKERKDEIIKTEFAEIIEILDPEKGFDVLGAMEHPINYLRRNIEQPIKSGNLRRVPMGILLTGPPGTGKTLLAECLAKEVGVNCAKLNLAKIFDSYVGSSERNLEKALSCLEALAPVVVIIDEMDQSGLNRENSGDSGVSNRLFKRLLEFMSDTDNRGKIIWMGITNRPDLLDPAIKRPGRLDKKLPILPPDEKGRIEILKVMFKKYNITYDLDLEKAAKETEGYTGAEIEALVLKALEVAEDNQSDAVKDEHMDHALNSYIPTTRDINSMIRLAIAECNDRDLLPPAYRHMLDERKKEKAMPAKRTVRAL